MEIFSSLILATTLSRNFLAESACKAACSAHCMHVMHVHDSLKNTNDSGPLSCNTSALQKQQELLSIPKVIRLAAFWSVEIRYSREGKL